MKKKLLFLIFSFCLISKAFAQDEIISENQLTLIHSNAALESIQKSLRTFSDINDIIFTDDVLDKIFSEKEFFDLRIDPNKFKKIEKNELDWRKQNLINPNHILRIKGTLLKMQMEINELRYRLALKENVLAQEELQNLKQNYLKSKKEFVNFLETYKWYE